MRIKQRYLIFQLIQPKTSSSGDTKDLRFGFRDIQNEIRMKIDQLYGDIGAGDLGSQTLVKYFDRDHSKLFMVRCPREAEVQVAFAVSCITNIKGVELLARSVLVKSSVRTCMESLKKLITSYCANYYSDEQRRNEVCTELLNTLTTTDL